MELLPEVSDVDAGGDAVRPATDVEPSNAHDVLQLLLVRDRGDAAEWADAVLDTASRNDGFRGGVASRSADGGSLVVGLRWRDLDSMSQAALSSAPLLRPSRRVDDEPDVLVFVSDGARSVPGADHAIPEHGHA